MVNLVTLIKGGIALLCTMFSRITDFASCFPAAFVESASILAGDGLICLLALLPLISFNTEQAFPHMLNIGCGSRA